MLINKLEAELILYHIDKEAKFGYVDAGILEVIITEAPADIDFTPDELWWIIRCVPVEGDFAKIYHAIKVKAARDLATEYHFTWRTPAEVEADDKQLEEMFNARQDEGEAQSEAQGSTGETGGAESRRVLPRPEDQDRTNNRPADTLSGCGNLPEHRAWVDSLFNEEGE